MLREFEFTMTRDQHRHNKLLSRSFDAIPRCSSYFSCPNCVYLGKSALGRVFAHGKPSPTAEGPTSGIVDKPCISVPNQLGLSQHGDIYPTSC